MKEHNLDLSSTTDAANFLMVYNYLHDIAEKSKTRVKVSIRMGTKKECPSFYSQFGQIASWLKLNLPRFDKASLENNIMIVFLKTERSTKNVKSESVKKVVTGHD